MEVHQVLIIKILSHPNMVNLIEVIDDPNTDHFCMVLEYMEGKWVIEGAGLPGGLGQNVLGRYLRDIVSGLMYLYSILFSCMTPCSIQLRYFLTTIFYCCFLY
ncbi:putative protein kinase CAMK-CAMKL-LKB family [Helianthus anomalus]